MTAVTALARTACEEVEMLLSPSIDGELLDDDLVLVTQHVRDCEHCRGRLAQLKRLKLAVAASAQSVELPDALMLRIRADVRRQNRGVRFLRAGIAASVVGALGVTGAMFLLGGENVGGKNDEARVAAVAPRSMSLPPHMVRSLVERHRLDLPVDVASPDARRVSEFLAQRVGHGVVVPRLDALGWGLEGGRVVDVDQQRGAQLVYSGGYGQRLSVVAVPDPDGLFGNGPVTAVADGLHLRSVSHQGAVYSFVSDVDDARLESLSNSLR